MATGRDILLEVLRTEGVRHLFGNPGTTELPLVDALVDAPDLHYVLALQEATAVAMADGYAQITGRPSFLNLHTSAGLGNAIGNLTNAMANRAPIVVTAGQQDYRHIVSEPLLSGDLVRLASGATKWQHEVRTPAELGTVLRRAFHDAASAPSGPVFVSLPMDIVDAEGDLAAPAASRIQRATVAEGVDELADLLASIEPSRLAIVAGDEVAAAGGIEALVKVAETLGCRVHASPLSSTVPFPSTHPLYVGALAPAAAAIAQTLAAYDVVFLVGGQAFLVYPYTPGSPVPDGVDLVHLSPAVTDVGRSHPVRLGLVGDPRATLTALQPLLAARVDHYRATASADDIATATAGARATYEQAALARYDDVPMQPIAAAHALTSALPDGSIVVQEAPTFGGHARAFHRAEREGQHFFCKGGGLGWGMPAALGVSLGADRHPVLCIVGDGSAMYSPQALWTAAHEDLPVVFAVVNNRQYLILKNALRQRGGATAKTSTYIGMDIDEPPVDFVALARSMGVEGTTVEKAGDVTDAVLAALDSGGPALLELPIAAR
ncbi:MAG TPA: thiamine pyrophosphate-binding protein [Acidimicrobiales bacterium]|nr:thiamine pyrophosphate-binding protein [Acidimicrobiales bacterium]